MKTYFKRGLYALVLALSYYQGFSQSDTLCGKKTSATINLVYGGTRTTLTAMAMPLT